MSGRILAGEYSMPVPFVRISRHKMNVSNKHSITMRLLYFWPLKMFKMPWLPTQKNNSDKNQ